MDYIVLFIIALHFQIYSANNRVKISIRTSPGAVTAAMTYNTITNFKNCRNIDLVPLSDTNITYTTKATERRDEMQRHFYAH